MSAPNYRLSPQADDGGQDGKGLVSWIKNRRKKNKKAAEPEAGPTASALSTAQATQQQIAPAATPSPASSSPAASTPPKPTPPSKPLPPTPESKASAKPTPPNKPLPPTPPDPEPTPTDNPETISALAAPPDAKGNKPLHVVDGNDHISRIALQHGYSNWSSLWALNPQLAAKRKNPHILFHGTRGKKNADVVKTPPLKEKEEAVATEQVHTFKVPVSDLFLRLRILDEDLQPVADADYTLTVEGRNYTGKTAADGTIIQEITRGAQNGWLTLNMKDESPEHTAKMEQAKKEGQAKTIASRNAESTPAETAATASSTSAAEVKARMAAAPQSKPSTTKGLTTGQDRPALGGQIKFALRIGRLDPILEDAPDRWCVAGVQARLNNLGFESGPVDGVKGPVTKAAIKRFQRRFKLVEDGIAGPVTQAKLKEVHDTNTPIPPQIQPATGQAGQDAQATSTGTAQKTTGKAPIDGTSSAPGTPPSAPGSTPSSSASPSATPAGRPAAPAST